jgi:hypothetical protein
MLIIAVKFGNGRLNEVRRWFHHDFREERKIKIEERLLKQSITTVTVSTATVTVVGMFLKKRAQVTGSQANDTTC